MKNRTNVRWLTQLALLVAVLLVMNYTPLGYLQVGPLSMSLLTIPVAIGAMTLGPVAGAILGGVFGTTSFVSALRTPSVMSAAMLQASPVGTFITCFMAFTTACCWPSPKSIRKSVLFIKNTGTAPGMGCCPGLPPLTW